MWPVNKLFRQISRLCVVVGIVGCINPRCFADWETYQHDLQNTGYADISWNPAWLGKSWSSPAGFTAPIVQGSRIYASRLVRGSSWPIIQYASFDLQTGEQRWTQSVEWPSNAAAVLNGMLVTFDHENHLRVFDADTGALLHDTVYGGMGSNMSSPALVDAGNGAIEAYFSGSNGFTRFNITRTSSALAWQFDDQVTGGTPTVAGESVLSTGPGAYVAYRRSDGQRNLFYIGSGNGGAINTGLYDAQLHRFYSDEGYGDSGNALSAWDYQDNGHVSFLWAIPDRPPSFASSALDADGNLWFVDSSNILREYFPDGALLRSSTTTFAAGNTPVIQNGYIWVNDNLRTYALDLATLSPVQSLDGYNAGGNGFRSTAILFDQGVVLDRGGGTNGFDVYFTPEPASLSIASMLLLFALRRCRS